MYIAIRRQSSNVLYMDKSFFGRYVNGEFIPRYNDSDLQRYNYTKVEVPDKYFEKIIEDDFDYQTLQFNEQKYLNRVGIEKATLRITELKTLLKEQDFQTIKYIQGKLSQEKFNEVIIQCEEWRKEINDLEEKYNIK